MSKAVSLESMDNRFATQLGTHFVNEGEDPGIVVPFQNDDLRTVRTPFLLVATGVALTQLGNLVIGLIFVDTLRHFVPNVPLWGCYAAVGTLIVGMKAIAVFNAASELRAIKTFYKQSVRAIYRPVSVQWTRGRLT